MKSTKIADYIWKPLRLPIPSKELRFHPIRRWRFDFAFEDVKLAIEINGGVFTFGRHTRGAGFSKDMEKLNAAQELGWVVLQYTPSKIDYDQIKRIYDILIERWVI
jgi:very-short-patch-repair endonuclease